MSTKLEEASLQARQRVAVSEVQEEYSKYFTALNLHPRRLVGQEVPSSTGDGMETLRTSEDAREWQDAIKDLLSDEIRERAEQISEEDAANQSILHQSIELFQNNADLVPNTSKFDKELADSVAKFAKPYEVRADGKLMGYSIPLQALIDQERQVLKERRAAKPAAPATPGAPAAQQQQAPADQLAARPVTEKNLQQRCCHRKGQRMHRDQLGDACRRDLPGAGHRLQQADHRQRGGAEQEVACAQGRQQQAGMSSGNSVTHDERSLRQADVYWKSFACL